MNSPREDSMTAHGVMLAIFNGGVLLVGESGIGKSTLALELIRRGHRLIADDAPLFHLTPQAQLIGSCPPPLQNFLAVPGLGAIDVRAIYGEPAIALQHPLDLVIRLAPNRAVEPLTRILSEWERLGVKVPELTLPLTGNIQAATLIEAAAQDHRLRSRGYDALYAFTQQQHGLTHSPPKRE